MNIEQTINLIRENIVKINQEMNGENFQIEKKNKTSNSQYYEKQQLSMVKRADKKKIEKIKKGENIDNDCNCIGIDELEKKILEDKELIFKRPWNKLTAPLKKKSLQSFVNKISDLDTQKKNELINKLDLLLSLGKLTSRFINYNIENGIIESINKLTIDKLQKDYKLTI